MSEYDVIVIGSGAGGLAAAVALAQAGKKVLVLEQHYVPGGWCHSFNLGPYKFSPGVHYIGELGPQGRMRQIYEGLGVSKDLVFNELNPDGFDHILVDGERFDIPKGKEVFAQRLKDRFPEEREGIDKYLDACEGIAMQLGKFDKLRTLKEVVKLPFDAPDIVRWGLRPASSLINHYLKHPRLRAIVAGQSGDHGLPPSIVPAAVHASVVAHYFDGGWYPRGGGFTIPRAFVRALKRAGGELRLKTSVSRILLEGKRAIGVRLGDGTEIRAEHVISNADPHVTYKRMIGDENLSWQMRLRLRATRYSVSALSLFFATDLDLRGAGLDSGNYWSYLHDDIDKVYREGMTAWDLKSGDMPGMFLTATTLKDPSKLHSNHHTLESFAFVSYDAFSQWAKTNYGDRPEDYKRMKADLTERMIANLGRICPELPARIVFSELGTPLTNAYYVEATRGNLYGTEKRLRHVGPWAFPIRTEYPGLLMCGASTIGHGVLGATYSGLAAASKVLKCRLHHLLTQRGPELQFLPSDHPERWPEALKPRALREPARAAPAPAAALHASA